MQENAILNDLNWRRFESSHQKGEDLGRTMDGGFNCLSEQRDTAVEKNAPPRSKAGQVSGRDWETKASRSNGFGSLAGEDCAAPEEALLS
jgi:hypothetical protein